MVATIVFAELKVGLAIESALAVGSDINHETARAVSDSTISITAGVGALHAPHTSRT